MNYNNTNCCKKMMTCVNVQPKCSQPPIKKEIYIANFVKEEEYLESKRERERERDICPELDDTCIVKNTYKKNKLVCYPYSCK